MKRLQDLQHPICALLRQALGYAYTNGRITDDDMIATIFGAAPKEYLVNVVPGIKLDAQSLGDAKAKDLALKLRQQRCNYTCSYQHFSFVE